MDVNDKIRSYLHRALKSLSQNEQVLARLIQARKIYEELTGKIDEDQEEYESRMLSFNEWFLFDFVAEDQQVPFIVEFLNSLPSGEPVEEIKDLFSSVRYSFFECRKPKLGSNFVLEDFLQGTKYKIPPKDFPVELLDSEIFTGRIISLDRQAFLFRGIRWLPKMVRPLMVKEAKKIRKLGNLSREREFIFSLEMAATKCCQFKHVEPLEVFSSLVL